MYSNECVHIDFNMHFLFFCMYQFLYNHIFTALSLFCIFAFPSICEGITALVFLVYQGINFVKSLSTLVLTIHYIFVHIYFQTSSATIIYICSVNISVTFTVSKLVEILHKCLLVQAYAECCVHQSQ